MSVLRVCSLGFQGCFHMETEVRGPDHHTPPHKRPGAPPPPSQPALGHARSQQTRTNPKP